MNPNTWLTRLRFLLVTILEPKPPLGEGWCVNCSMNEFRTFVFPVEGVEFHTRQHVQSGDHGFLRIMFGQYTEKEEDH